MGKPLEIPIIPFHRCFVKCLCLLRRRMSKKWLYLSFFFLPHISKQPHSYNTLVCLAMLTIPLNNWTPFCHHLTHLKKSVPKTSRRERNRRKTCQTIFLRVALLRVQLQELVFLNLSLSRIKLGTPLSLIFVRSVLGTVINGRNCYIWPPNRRPMNFECIIN